MRAWWQRMQAIWLARGGYAAAIFILPSVAVFLWRRTVLAAYFVAAGFAAIAGTWWVGPVALTAVLVAAVVADAAFSGGHQVYAQRSRLHWRSFRIEVRWTWRPMMENLGLIRRGGSSVPRLISVTLPEDAAPSHVVSGVAAGLRRAFGKIEAVESELVLRVALPQGAVHADWIASAERMSSWWDCRRVCVDYIDSRTVDVRLFFGAVGTAG